MLRFRVLPKRRGAGNEMHFAGVIDKMLYEAGFINKVAITVDEFLEIGDALSQVLFMTSLYSMVLCVRQCGVKGLAAAELFVAGAAGPGRKLRFLLSHASGAWSEAPLPARPCIRGLVGSSASCSAMHPGAWSEAPLPARPCIRGLVGSSASARPCIRGLVGSSASCSAMHPGPGRKLRFLLGHASGAWSEAPLPARPCIRGLVGSSASCSAMHPGPGSEAPLPARPCIRGLVGSSASCSAMHPGPGRKAPLPARPCIRGPKLSFFFDKKKV